MVITIEDVKKTAELAKIQISPEEASYYLKSLRNILKLAKQMDAVDTQSTQPVAHPFGITQIFRPDKIKKTVPLNLQQLTQHVRANFFCVPLVLE